MTLGGKLGLLNEGTIENYNGDGTVNLRLPNVDNLITASLPLSFSGPNGEFIGGYPSIGTSVAVSYGQGKYYISSFLPTNKVFKNSLRNLLTEFTPGSILIQTEKAANRILLNPTSGISLGSPTANEQVDPKRGILSHNFQNEMAFTAAHRSIIGIIQRDIKENSTRNLSSSILDSHEYSDSLVTIGMDPSTATSVVSAGNSIRNLPLVENHEIIYEFQNFDNGVTFTTDDDEAERYISKKLPDRPSQVLRKDSRTDTFNLNLSNPNHLMETIKGTGVDLYGNILDLNRDIIPIGKLKDFNLNENSDKKDAFKKIRALHRKSLAFHWEINARKQTGEDEVTQVENPTSIENYGRARSRFFVDIDKEGQFKINIPASSETGNVPVLARYETSSTIAASMGLITDPNQLIKESNHRDILHQGFANAATIMLKGNLDGYESPNDVLLNKPIKLGTAYHDIKKTILMHQNNNNERLINYFKTNETYLNKINYIDSEDIISDTVYVSGPKANAGGRSGTINMDGHLSLNLGANSSDRQSLWVDTAGGVVANIGRDLNGHSYKATLDGDLLMQIGSTGVIGDKRFDKENNGLKAGVVDIRVVSGDGQLSIIRIDTNGMFLATPGRLEINSAQDLVLNSKANIILNGENVIMYGNSGSSRVVKRSGVREI